MGPLCDHLLTTRDSRHIDDDMYLRKAFTSFLSVYLDQNTHFVVGLPAL